MGAGWLFEVRKDAANGIAPTKAGRLSPRRTSLIRLTSVTFSRRGEPVHSAIHSAPAYPQNHSVYFAPRTTAGDTEKHIYSVEPVLSA